MWRLLLLAAVFAAGCDQVFGLSRPDAPPSQCPLSVVGNLDADDDGDGKVNREDNCPFAGNPAQHDEDGDGAGDLCDLCPASEETSDLDCDRTGDACDPDDTRRDVRQFFAFETDVGLTLADSTSGTSLVSDQLQIRKDAATSKQIGFANVDLDVAAEGLYEITFTTQGIPTLQFTAIEIRFGCNIDPYPKRGNYARFWQSGSQPAFFELGDFDEDRGLRLYAAAVTEPAGMMMNGTYTLRVITAPGGTHAELVHDGSTIDLDAGPLLPPVSGPTRFAVRALSLDVDVDYLLRVGPPLP